jgi:mRNA-degrading endonuclease RelE of RelBE toxin-antitoxin system
MANSKLDDETRDAILKRMLETPPKPHAPLKSSKRNRTTPKGRARVGKSRS